MSSSDRNKQRRTLGFEHLEAKVSPTALFTGTVSVEVPRAAEVAAQHLPVSAGLLAYVAAMLDDIRIEREIPTQADANSADDMLAAETPDTV